MTESGGSKLKGLAWLGFALLGAALVASGFSTLARLTPWSWERKLGSAVGGFEGALECHGAEGRAALGVLVSRLYPIYPEDASVAIDVGVIRGETVNAFAFLGGRIYVYEGLLLEAQSADELAGVLAHEMEHVRGRHILEGMLVRLMGTELLKLMTSGSGSSSAQLSTLLLSLRFGRDQERAADEGGLKRLKDAQVDVGGFKRFFERAANEALVPTLLSDHPSGADRAERVERFRGGTVRAVLRPEQWAALRGICK